MNKIKELLRQIEWAENEVCFICKQTIAQGHRLDCNMSKIFALIEAESQPAKGKPDVSEEDWEVFVEESVRIKNEEIAQLKAHIDRLEYTLIPELETKVAELEAALNMEEAYSQFHPKIPYKWKYENQLKRTKRQGRFIKKQVARIKGLEERIELALDCLPECPDEAKELLTLLEEKTKKGGA